MLWSCISLALDWVKTASWDCKKKMSFSHLIYDSRSIMTSVPSGGNTYRHGAKAHILMNSDIWFSAFDIRFHFCILQVDFCFRGREKMIYYTNLPNWNKQSYGQVPILPWSHHKTYAKVQDIFAGRYTFHGGSTKYLGNPQH